jgi:hypothetical protein
MAKLPAIKPLLTACGYTARLISTGVSMMRHCILCLLVLIAPPLSAQPLAPQAAPPAQTEPTPAQDDAAPAPGAAQQAEPAPPSAPAALSPELTPEQQLTQFRRDQINLLALRADGHVLLAAALMALPDGTDKSRPAALKTPALLARAQKYGADDPLVWWATAGIECHAPTAACPASETLQQLEKTDAQNAAVWALALAHAQQAKEETTARAALTSAAQATQYDDHFGALVAALNAAADVLPVSEEILRASGQGGVSTAGYKLTFAAGVAASLPQPGLRAVVETCKDPSGDAALAADCVAVAQKIADCGSLITRSYGIKLLTGLLPAGGQQDSARARSRVLAWQMQRISELGGRLADDSRITRVYLDALAQRGQEIDAVQAVLRNQGVASEPPADWRAPQ